MPSLPKPFTNLEASTQKVREQFDKLESPIAKIARERAATIQRARKGVLSVRQAIAHGKLESDDVRKLAEAVAFLLDEIEKR